MIKCVSINFGMSIIIIFKSNLDMKSRQITSRITGCLAFICLFTIWRTTSFTSCRLVSMIRNAVKFVPPYFEIKKQSYKHFRFRIDIGIDLLRECLFYWDFMFCNFTLNGSRSIVCESRLVRR